VEVDRVRSRIPLRSRRRGEILSVSLVLALIWAASLLLSPRVSAVSLDGEETRALNQINRERRERGLPSVAVSLSLQAAAEWHSADQAVRGLIEHTDSLGRTIRPRFSSFGYPSFSMIRENVAFGPGGGEAVVALWMSSPGHRANILAVDPVAVGIARARTGPDAPWYWTLDFGSILDDDDRLDLVTSPAEIPRWALLGWVHVAAPVLTALQPYEDAYSAVFGWDAAARDFRSFASDLPAALNGLGALEHGGAYWVRLRGGELGGPWPPSPGRVGTSVELEEGFNLVAWLGPDGVSLREAVQSLGEALLGAWAWEFGRQQFLSYQPGLPDGLYDDAVIFRGDGIWIRVGSAMRWDQSVG